MTRTPRDAGRAAADRAAAVEAVEAVEVEERSGALLYGFPEPDPLQNERLAVAGAPRGPAREPTSVR
jgi:hypothetical protein